jgi:hypothetical protein
MQWGESETSPSVEIISFNISLHREVSSLLILYASYL